MQSDFSKTFNACPVCGSEKQFFAELAKESKERKLVPDGYSLRLINHNDAAIDKTKMQGILVGTTVPGFHVACDVCADCGTVYCVELRRLEVSTRAATPPQRRNQQPPFPRSTN